MESVRTWSPKQVTDWMRGLDDVLQPYVCSLEQQQVDGERLLSLSHQELLPLGVSKVGHQELLLEAVELLRALNAGVESEHLKTLMGKMRNAERSLSSAVLQRRKSPAYQHRHAHLPSNHFLTAVVELIAGAKSLLSWLDRACTTDCDTLSSTKGRIIHLCLELTSTVQKNCTVFEMEEKILEVSQALNSVCEKTVQEISQPSQVEPSCLEEVHITKVRPSEGLGIYIKSTYDGLHIITGTTENSPAEKTKRIHAGDEVIQVNKQTVVGWQLKHLVDILRAESEAVALMVKKRPSAMKGGSAPAPLRNLRWRPPLIQTSQTSQTSQSTLSPADVPVSRTKDTELDSYIPRSPATPDGGVLVLSPEVKMRPRSPHWRLDADMWRRSAVAGDDDRTESLQPTAVRLRQRPASVCKARPVSMPAESFSAVFDLSSRSGTHRRKGPPLHRCLSNERISTVAEEEPHRAHLTAHRVDHIRGSRCLVSADLLSGPTVSHWETPPTKPAASGSAPPLSQGVTKQSVLGGWLARLRLLSH